MQSSSIIKVFFITSFVLFTVYLAAVSFASATETVDRIVAVVNEDIIRLRELNIAFEPVAEQIYAQNYAEPKERKLLYEKRNEVLNQLIDETLIDQVVRKKGISVSSSEIDNAIERIKSMNYYTDEDLRDSLKVAGMDMQTYRDEIRRQILRSKMVNREVKASIVITDSEIRDYYENHPEKYKGATEYHLKNIFIPYADGYNPDSESASRKKIVDAMTELNNGQVFETVARKYSESANAVDGGDLGNFAINDLQKELQPVIKNLAIGEASPIIETEQGFQIFHLEEIVKAPDKPFDMVAEKLRDVLYRQAVDKKFEEWLSSLREESHIRITR